MTLSNPSLALSLHFSPSGEKSARLYITDIKPIATYCTIKLHFCTSIHKLLQRMAFEKIPQ